jgi:hypothetical protein
MKNLTTSEVHKIRPTFTMSLEAIRKLNGINEEAPKGPPVRMNGMQGIEDLSELRGRDNDISLEDYGMELDDTIIYD